MGACDPNNRAVMRLTTWRRLGHEAIDVAKDRWCVPGKFGPSNRGYIGLNRPDAINGCLVGCDDDEFRSAIGRNGRACRVRKPLHTCSTSQRQC